MKNKFYPIRPEKGPDCYKTNAHWLAEALGAKWSGRRGYTVASANRQAQWALLNAQGWFPSRRWLAGDKRPYVFSHPVLSGGQSVPLGQAVRLAAFPSLEAAQ